MNLVRRYKSHLAYRAAGLSGLGWYAASAREGAPWLLGIAAATTLASFIPEPNRLLAMCVVFIPGFIGWTATQIYMGIVHMRDLRSRTGV